MKKNPILKLFILVIALTMVTSSLVSGTFAKYTTTVSATDTVTVAKWHADFNGEGTTTSVKDTTFKFFNTAFTNIESENMLAPGTHGSFTFEYDTDDSQVARNVTITLDASAVLDKVTNIEFYTNSTKETPISSDATGVFTLISEDVNAGANDTGEVSVYWEWPFDSDGAGGTANDAIDTADGIDAGIDSLTVTATFTATQVIPAVKP